MSNSKQRAAQAPARPDAAATAADIALSARLIPSTAKPIGKVLSGKLVGIYAAPSLQQKLLSIQTDLTAFEGCGDVQTMIDLANEGDALLAAYDRLINSAGRVRQRFVEINKRLQPTHTALVKAKKSAASNGAVAKGLAGIAGLRKAAVTAAKAKGTKTKKKNTAKKKAAAAAATAKG